MGILSSMFRIFLQQQVLHREFWFMFVLNGVLPVVVPLLAWVALAQSTADFNVDGWSIDEFMSYYVITFIIFALSFTSVHSQMSELVHTGQLNYWLLRPVNMMEFAVSFSVARFAVMAVFCTLVIIGLQIVGLPVFTSLSQVGLAVLVLPLAILLLILLTVCIGMLAFWLIQCDGAFAAILLFLQFFGGLILPIGLFPSWVQPLAAILPLRFAFGLPAEAIVNQSFADVPVILFGQLAWLHLIYLFTVYLWQKGLQQYDAVGA